MSKIEKIEIKKMALLESMDKAHIVLSRCELNGENINDKINEMESELVYVMDQLSLSISEALWFCILYNINTEDTYVAYTSIARYLRSRITFIYRFVGDIGKLVSKGLIKKDYRMNRNGKLTENIILTDFARKLVHENLNYKDEKNMFDFKQTIINNVIDEIRSTVHLPLFDFDQVNQCYDSIEMILRNNKSIRFIRILATLQFQEKIDKILLTYFCVQYADGFDNLRVAEFLEHVSHDKKFKQETIKRYKAGKSELLTKNWVQFSQSLNNSDFTFSLTEKTYNIILKGDFSKIENKIMDSDQLLIIQPEDIARKELFHNPTITEEIQTLEQLLDEQRLKTIMASLQKNGFTRGFTILLYGAPGTGKTETVYQLARNTERMIFQVNISQIRAMWVGESEKNLQKIFDTYHYNNNVTKRTPILLLNEADALLGKRINIAHSVDQMNNSMQNILLQELERFEGILIATTNLKQNLDQAFDRRFLYKIKFTSPEAEVRRLIINNKLPDIPDYFRIMLAESYMLTGAQLENIKKKYHVHKLLQQEEPDINRIEKWCMEETENAGNSSKIGFKISNNA